MHGNLLERGIGWYLYASDLADEALYDERQNPYFGSVNPGHVLGFTLGMVYVVSPLDFIPDFIPVLGMIDDAIVLRGSTGLGGMLWELFD